MKLIHAIAVLGMAATVAACEKEVILEGERINPRDVLSGTAPEAEAPAQAVALSLPAQVSNADWPQRAGGPGHNLVNAALGQGLALQWAAPIGQGNDRKHRIAASPVVAQGRIFTLDSRARVSATGQNGATLWQADLTPASDNTDDASGGGLAVAGGTVFATTGFGELVALDAATGARRWAQKFDVAVGGAPTVSDGVVYVAARDASSWAIDAATGKVLWQLAGTPGNSAMMGVSAPAVTDKAVIFPYSGGEMIAALKKGGLQMWQSSVPGARPGRAYASVSDLTGDPVVAGGTVYAGSSAGKIAAFDLETGTRLWSAAEGANAPVQVAGGSVFAVTDEGRLVRLSASDGSLIWATDLPYYVKDKVKKQRNIHAHFGPVLAGGKLFVASSDGLLRAYDPANGALIGSAEIAGGASAAPVVAGRALYVVTGAGKLLAFR